MELVGLPLEEGFRRLFADLPEDRWRAVMQACTEEEDGLLESGGVALMPGADATLAELSGLGKRLGIASNCSRSYLDHMLGAGLGERVQASYCLDSGGIGDKADMIAELLGDFDTRSAIFVGDRRGDRDAAWANGLPHVHCAFGFRPDGEDVRAEGVLEDLGELPDLLRRRAVWIAEALECLGVPGGARIIGITGAPASGKTLFARDAARLLESGGVEAAAVSLDACRRTELLDGASTAEELYDLEGALAEVFARLPADRPVFVDGAYLLDPRLRGRFDRILHLDLPEDLQWQRLAGREGRLGGPRALDPAREVFVPGYRAHRARFDAAGLADLVLDARNPLGMSREGPGAGSQSPSRVSSA